MSNLDWQDYFIYGLKPTMKDVEKQKPTTSNEAMHVECDNMHFEKSHEN